MIDSRTYNLEAEKLLRLGIQVMDIYKEMMKNHLA